MIRLVCAAALAGVLSLSPVASHHAGAAFTNEGHAVQLLNPTNGLPPGWGWSGGPLNGR
jgi:hypothetical protein